METTNEINEKAVDRIRKLFNQSESAHKIGNLAEAETFAKKANDLLVKYNLSKFHIGDKKEENGFKRFDFHGVTNKKNEGQWIFTLYNTIAIFNFCKCIRLNTYVKNEDGFYQPRKVVTLIGQEENVETVVFICEQLEEKIRYIARKTYSEVKDRTSEKKNAFLRAFYSGAVTGIFHKLSLQKKEMEEQEKSNPEYSGITALVLYHNDKIAKVVDEEFGELGKPRRTTLKAELGKQLGFIAGKEMDINKGIGSNNGQKQMIN